MFQYSNDYNCLGSRGQNCRRACDMLLLRRTLLKDSDYKQLFNAHGYSQLLKGLPYKSSSNIIPNIKEKNNNNPTRKIIMILYHGFSNSQSKDALEKTTRFLPIQKLTQQNMQ